MESLGFENFQLRLPKYVFTQPLHLSQGLTCFSLGWKELLDEIPALRTKAQQEANGQERVNEFIAVIESWREIQLSFSNPDHPLCIQPSPLWLLPDSEDLQRMPSVRAVIHEQDSMIKFTLEKVFQVIHSQDVLDSVTSRMLPFTRPIAEILCGILGFQKDMADSLQSGLKILDHPAGLYQCSCKNTSVMSFRAIQYHIFIVHRDFCWDRYRAILAEPECQTALAIYTAIQPQIPAGREVVQNTRFSCWCNFGRPHAIQHFVPFSTLVGTLVSLS